MILFPLLVAGLASCDQIISAPVAEPGYLQLSFEAPSSKAPEEIPDTNLFLLSIEDDSGRSVFRGAYSSFPKELALAPGTYSVSALSRDFSEPLFGAPQFGDEQDFVIESAAVSAVHLRCAQINAGVRLQTSKSFMAEYPDGLFYLRSSSGDLVYSYGEGRTGYFKPGPVWLDFCFSGSTATLLTRELKAREVLVLRIDTGKTVKSVSPTAETYGDGLSIEVDTSLIWTYENFFLNPNNGSGGGDVDLSGALSVGQARSRAEEELEGVWVYGYIVGGDCTSSGCSFTAPFKSATNLLLAPGAASAEKGDCLAVQLQKGDIRMALNLADHPENLGHLLYVKGDLVPKYYGIPGIQDISDFRLK